MVVLLAEGGSGFHVGFEARVFRHDLLTELRSVCVVLIGLLAEVPDALEYYWRSVRPFNELETHLTLRSTGCGRGLTSH